MLERLGYILLRCLFALWWKRAVLCWKGGGTFCSGTLLYCGGRGRWHIEKAGGGHLVKVPSGIVGEEGGTMLERQGGILLRYLFVLWWKRAVPGRKGERGGHFVKVPFALWWTRAVRRGFILLRYLFA